MDDESKLEPYVFSSDSPPPQDWDTPDNPPYSYYLYYMYSNITQINKLRRCVCDLCISLVIITLLSMFSVYSRISPLRGDQEFGVGGLGKSLCDTTLVTAEIVTRLSHHYKGIFDEHIKSYIILIRKKNSY